MRSAIVCRISFLVALASPGLLSAQTGTTDARPHRLALGAFAGYGEGPTPSVVWGGEVEVPAGRTFRIRAEVFRTRSGVRVSCPQEWPTSYRCSVEAWAALAGITAALPSYGRVAPYVELLGGHFSRAPAPGAEERTGSTALALEAGAELDLALGWQLDAGGRYLRPFDDDYEAFMNESLGYILAVIGLKYRIPPGR